MSRDWSMCGTPDCPLSITCRRSPDHGTEPSPWGQAWAAFEPIETRSGEVVCEGFKPAVRVMSAPRQFDQGRIPP